MTSFAEMSSEWGGLFGESGDLLGVLEVSAGMGADPVGHDWAAA